MAAENKTMKTDIKTILEQYRSGSHVSRTDSISAIVSNSRVDLGALALVAKDLREADSDVRRELIYYLVEVGQHIDQPAPGKERLLRESSILRVLLTDGFAKNDSASTVAETLLLEASTAGDLASHRGIILNYLKKQRSDIVMLAAKAKILEARPHLELMIKQKDLDADEKVSLQVALAALGDTKIEEKYLAALEKADKGAPPAPQNQYYDIGTAKDGSRAAELVKTLGYIGTKRALLVICSYLRSNLKSYKADISEKSVRIDAVAALRYNFPDEIALRPPRKREEWEAVEKFCAARLGATFIGPTPEMAGDFPYPRF